MNNFSPDPSVKFKILLQDPDFLVVEKKSGLHIHPLKEDEMATLYQGVIAQYPEIASIGHSPREGGLLHRLDLETSGLVLFARHQKAYDFLREEFKKRRVKKEYLALVEGSLQNSEGSIEIPIAHHGKNKRKMLCVKHDGIKVRGEKREAVTHYQVLEAYPGASFLKIEIPTGVRHQIRVHMAFIGHPIVGDKLYGKQNSQTLEIPRLFLHASQLSFRHPSPPHSLVTVSCPLADDLSKALQILSATKN